MHYINTFSKHLIQHDLVRLEDLQKMHMEK